MVCGVIVIYQKHTDLMRQKMNAEVLLHCSSCNRIFSISFYFRGSRERGARGDARGGGGGGGGGFFPRKIGKHKIFT